MLIDRAIPLEMDGEHGDLAPFTALDDLAARARVAFIGEMDHYVAEKYDYRLLCIRYLVSRGWRWFGEEWAADRGRRVDAFLRSGDAQLLEGSKWSSPKDQLRREERVMRRSWRRALAAGGDRSNRSGWSSDQDATGPVVQE